MNIKRITKISLMIAMIALGAIIKIPMPVIQYLTFQLAFVLLAGILLGSKDGLIATLIYVLGGLLGIPWFAEGGGIYYVLKPSFGFILMFPSAAVISGYCREYAERKKERSDFLIISIGAVCSTIIVWIIGMLYVAYIYQHVLDKDFGYFSALLSIFSPAFYKDIVFAFIATIVGIRVYKHIKWY